MNEQIEKTINELNELQNLLTKKREYEWYLSESNKNSYIKKKIGDMPVINEPIKPSKIIRNEKQLDQSYKKSAIGSGIVYVVLTVIVLLIFLSYLNSKTVSGKVFSMIGLWILGVPLVYLLFKLDENVLSKLRKQKQLEYSYNEETKRIVNYNEIDYPRLLKKYEEEYKLYEINKQEASTEYKQKEISATNEWEEKERCAKEELPSINERISSYSSLLDKKYYEYIPEIIKIFEKNIGIQNIQEATAVLEEMLKKAKAQMDDDKRKEEMLLLQRKAAGAARCSSCRKRYDCYRPSKGNESALDCWSYE